MLVGHEMSESLLAAAPTGFGLTTTDQLVPPHRSISVLCPALADNHAPTAKHRAGVGHATPDNVPCDVADRSGTGPGTMAQVSPLIRPTSGRVCCDRSR